MNKTRWTQIIHAAHTDPDLCGVLARFLASQHVELATRQLERDGRRLYEIKLEEPQIKGGERQE